MCEDIRTKICSRCNVEKDINNFHKEIGGLYGVRKLCKECRSFLTINGLSEKIIKPPLIIDGKKKCSKCGENKILDLFQKTIKNKIGYSSQCKDCLNKTQKQYIQDNPETKRRSDKKYCSKNKEKRKITHKKWRDKTGYTKSIKFKENTKRYAKTPNGRKYYCNYNKQYSKTEKGRLMHRVYRKRKTEEDPCFKIASVLRGRIRDGVKDQGAEKFFHSNELIGCSFKFLRDYLETMFQEGMFWGNHGSKGWHIDHIRPCASFKLTDPEQQKQCFHYTNLQPLWAFDNLSKGSKILSNE